MTYGQLHAGDIVLGDDGEQWGVEYVATQYGPGTTPFAVGLVRHGRRVVGYPSPHAEVVVVQQADTALEAGAFETLQAAGLNPEVISERWE